MLLRQGESVKIEGAEGGVIITTILKGVTGEGCKVEIVAINDKTPAQHTIPLIGLINRRVFGSLD